MSRWRRCVRAVGVSFGAVLVVLAAMAVQSVRAPGAENAEAKFAEWGRNHGLRPEVTWLEHVHHAPDIRLHPTSRD